MKIAITGSTGFVGRHLVEKLANQGHDIIALGRKDKGDFLNKNISYIRWDITQKATSIIKQEKIDIFIHSASETSWKLPVEKMIKINTDSVKNILEVANNTSHCVYISTGSVYQGMSGLDITEETEINTKDLQNSYALSKFLAEQEFLKGIGENTKLSIIRPRAVYGKGDRVLIPGILDASGFNQLLMFGNGEKQISVTHINNLINAIIFILKNQDNKSDIFNISDPDTTKMIDVFKLIKEKYGKKGIIHIPTFIINLLKPFNKSISSYLSDLFSKEKVLSTKKIQILGFKANSFDLERVINEEY